VTLEFPVPKLSLILVAAAAGKTGLFFDGMLICAG
jgi:hypothetical protein